MVQFTFNRQPGVAAGLTPAGMTQTASNNNPQYGSGPPVGTPSGNSFYIDQTNNRVYQGIAGSGWVLLP